MGRIFAVYLAVVLLTVSFTSAQEKTEPPAKPPVQRVVQGGNVVAASNIKKVSPKYPKEARKKRIQGVVRLHAIIGKDGSISDLQVVSGDPILTKAAMEAVRQWKYRPTLLEGRPVEVDTTIDVIFTLN